MSAASAAPTSRVVSLGAGRPAIEVLEAGQGTPLVYLHGAGGIPVWEEILPRLAERHRVVAPLLPGFGRSEGLELLDEPQDLFLHAFDVLEALGLERPPIVGESLGGWMAAEMAALRPREVGRLVLLAPIGLWRDEAPVVDMFGHMTHELVPYLFHDQSCAAAQRMLSLTAMFSERDDRTEEQVELLIGLIRGFRTAAKFLFPIPEHGLERRLWRIRTPTLVLWGENDRFVAPLYGKIFAEKIEGARLETIPHAGHLLASEAGEACAAAIERFNKS
jgi:pimeloyl-ACP methyl ester carboxylesterase